MVIVSLIAGSLIRLAIACILLSTSAFSQETPQFKMLVIGDSHISGQGLKEKDKFYSLVKDWLQKDVFASSRKVDLKVKAHAGSRITIHPEELKAMQKSGDDINTFHYGEANISTPSIKRQVDVAKAEYSDPAAVELVMLSGCITDVLVADIVNPFYPVKKLRERIKRFCGGSMEDLLAHTAAAFPNAAIVVVGYFPIGSVNSDIKTLSRYFLKIISVPPTLHFFFTNAVSRQFLKILRKKIAQRSNLWVRESNTEMIGAISRLQGNGGKRRMFFVEAPFTDEYSYGTKKPLLWEIGKDHHPNDATYAERKVGCAKVFSEMKYKHYGRLSRRMCDLSSVAHPNVEGARAYAEAIKKRLAPFLLADDSRLAN